MLYTPLHVLSASVSVTFVLLPAEYAAALWIGGLVIYYALTSVNAPEHTGKPRRTCPDVFLSTCTDAGLEQWLAPAVIIISI